MDYAAHYERLIARAKARVLSGYVERHHVKPRCMGGGDEISNVVALTAEEHFVAHLLLCKMHPLNGKLATAAFLMATSRNGVAYGSAMRVGSRTYGRLRREAALAISHALKGKKKSPEHVAKVAAAQRGRKRGKQSPERIEHRSAAQRGTKRATAECPRCGKVGGKACMVRWHFDNCRSVNQSTFDLIQ